MEEAHREKLRTNRVAFVKDLIVNEDFLAYMEQYDILTQAMIEEIEVQVYIILGCSLACSNSAVNVPSRMRIIM